MKQTTVNTFGALGYSSLLLQWLWSVLTLGMSLLTSDTVKNIFLPSQVSNPQPVKPAGYDLPQGIEILITIIAVVVALGIIVYALISVPRAIGKGGRRVTQQSAQAALPHLTHHKPLSPKQERRLLERITWAAKFILVIIPALLLILPPTSQLGLSHMVVAASGIVLFVVSLALFMIQFVLARVWKIPSKQVW